MPTIDIVVESPVSNSIRVAQVSAMFDVPAAERSRLSWSGNLPIEDAPWSIGLLVGPSGSGKSTILNRTFGAPAEFTWTGASVLDDFPAGTPLDAIAAICQAVGFNTIPAWMRPYAVLSNGERFRVDLARRLLEGGPLVVCDEFTSVVDRQTAHIGAHAAQKFIRSQGRQLVVASCHYDLEDWLQPDWVFEPATMMHRRRSLQRRPDIACSLTRTSTAAWATFARFHYLTAELPANAKCFVLAVDGTPAAFAGVIHRPHPLSRGIYGMSRLVTLPDFQGLGLAFALADRVASAYRALGYRYHSYPAHPGLIRSFDRSPVWELEARPGTARNSSRMSGGFTKSRSKAGVHKGIGGRPCAVFSYCGPAMDDRAMAHALID